MTLKEPFMISSRLLPAIKICGCTLSIDITGVTNDGRDRYLVYFDFDDGREYADGDIKSGCQGGSLQEGMECCLSFLTAAAESYRYNGFEGENADLFPQWIVEWAYEFCNEIELLRMELEETKDLITE